MKSTDARKMLIAFLDNREGVEVWYGLVKYKVSNSINRWFDDGNNLPEDYIVPVCSYTRSLKLHWREELLPYRIPMFNRFLLKHKRKKEFNKRLSNNRGASKNSSNNGYGNLVKINPRSWIAGAFTTNYLPKWRELNNKWRTELYTNKHMI